MDESTKKELWEFVGAAKTQFKTNNKLLTEIKADMRVYHNKLDKHLTLHKYAHRIVSGVAAAVVGWWQS